MKILISGGGIAGLALAFWLHRYGHEAVTVTRNDGRTETYDLLTGADGVHSQTGALLFGPEEPFARHLGYYVASYTLPNRYGLGHNWYSFVQPGRQAANVDTAVHVKTPHA